MKIAIIGSHGAIGCALVDYLQHTFPDSDLYTFSRTDHRESDHKRTHFVVSYLDENSLARAAQAAHGGIDFDWVIVTTGMLHSADDNIQPEKSLRDLSVHNFTYLFQANTIVPALAAKYFLPLMRQDRCSIFAALSARIGSISDNKIGGWYAYRASKTALNMVIKNAAIETKRRHKNITIVGLHPGTVASPLSKPFQSNVPDQQLFTPEYAAEKLTHVMQGLSPKDSGKCFAWDGQEIPP